MITDLEPYQEELAAFNLDDSKKLELVNALAQVVDHFVDKAFGRNSTQLALQENLALSNKTTILFMDWLYG